MRVLFPIIVLLLALPSAVNASDNGKIYQSFETAEGKSVYKTCKEYSPGRARRKCVVRNTRMHRITVKDMEIMQLKHDKELSDIIHDKELGEMRHEKREMELKFQMKEMELELVKARH